MLVFTSGFTGQTVLRYFNDEDVACKFINFILSKNPAEEIIFQ